MVELSLFQDDPYHLIAYASRFRKSRLEIFLYSFKAILVGGKVTE